VSAWLFVGLGWWGGTAWLAWEPPAGEGVRRSVLVPGARRAFTVVGDRTCTGVWRAGRRIRCPQGAAVTARARGAQCAGCRALDRSHSVAADTKLDDPRPFAVYLAHHGGVVKVGITAAQRGVDRLLEQGALSSVSLSSGPLMAARRTESLLGTALGLPDRVLVRAKRAAREHPGTPEERAADLRTVAQRALALPGWPAAQLPRPVAPVDHTAGYGLPAGGMRPVAAVPPLGPGHTVAGRVVCRIGADVYLDTRAGLVLLDTRLLNGFPLQHAPPGADLDAPLHPLDAPDEPQGLF
jgi:hypothetical protein